MSDVCCPDEPKPEPERKTSADGKPSFSHGRSNTVVVEVKRRRKVLKP